MNLRANSSHVTPHQKHLCSLAIEIYKSLADINPDFMKPCFTIKESEHIYFGVRYHFP